MNERARRTGVLVGILAGLLLGSSAFACSGREHFGNDGGAGGGFAGAGGLGGEGQGGEGGDAGAPGGAGGEGGEGGEGGMPDVLCEGVTCLVPEAETCSMGKCVCDPDRCARLNMVCDASGRCVSPVPCTPACERGEVCLYARTGKLACACNAFEKGFCESGYQCEAGSRTCVEDTPCDPECSPGEVCNEQSRVCECGEGTCGLGFVCIGGDCTLRPPEDGFECDPDVGGPTDWDCIDEGGASVWRRKCAKSSECPDPTQYCFDGHCIRNECDSLAAGSNGTYFGGCDSVDGQWMQGDADSGTCLPIPAAGGGNPLGICHRVGLAKAGQDCADRPIAPDPSRTCAFDNACLAVGPFSGLRACYESLECGTNGRCVDGVCRGLCQGGNCPGGLTCRDGACIQECQNASQCRPGSTCLEGSCTPVKCTQAGGCAGGSYCATGGICLPLGRCEDACNGGSGPVQNRGDCRDVAGECISVVGNGATAVELGQCVALCEVFGDEEDPCPAFEGRNRYCSPDGFDTDDPRVPGVCQGQVLVEQQQPLGANCTPNFNSGGRENNPCEDGALCIGPAGSARCRQMCFCAEGFPGGMDRSCPTPDATCSFGTRCEGISAAGDNVGVCL